MKLLVLDKRSVPRGVPLSGVLLLAGAGMGTVSAKSLIEQIGWRGAEGWVIGLIVGIFLAAGATLLIVHLVSQSRVEADQKEMSRNQFNDAVERYGLTERESRKALAMAALDNTVQPHVMFQSISLFEKLVHGEIETLRQSGLSEEDRDIENTLIAGLRKKIGFTFLPLEHPLVSTRNISIGQSGAIFGRSNRTPVIQRAVVVENSEFDLTLQYNVEKEDVVQIDPGVKIRFAFSRQNDGMYGIELPVRRSEGDGTIVTGHTTTLKRNQLRQHVRIEVSLPLKVRLLKTLVPEKSQLAKGETMSARVADLSGGGLSFLSEQSLKPGDIISAGFTLPQGPLAGIAGKVIRISLQEGKTTTYYRHHVQFIKIEPVHREKIIKFVFEKQRQINQWR